MIETDNQNALCENNDFCPINSFCGGWWLRANIKLIQ